MVKRERDWKGRGRVADIAHSNQTPLMYYSPMHSDHWCRHVAAHALIDVYMWQLFLVYHHWTTYVPPLDNLCTVLYLHR